MPDEVTTPSPGLRSAAVPAGAPPIAAMIAAAISAIANIVQFSTHPPIVAAA